MKSRNFLLAVLLALMVFLPRVLDLGLFLAHDEDYINRWTRRSVQAIAGGRWGEVMGSTSGAGNQVWARTAARSLEFVWLRAQGQPVTFSDVADYPPEYEHLPGAVLCALAVLAAYPFARAAFGGKTAYLAVALLALDPFLLAESRAIRMEGGYSVFMVLALVSLAAYVRTDRRRYLVWTGVWFAWAGIAKISALSLLPVILVVLLVVAWWRYNSERIPSPTAGVLPAPDGIERRRLQRSATWLRRGGLDFLVVLAVGAVAFVALWPRLWAEPVQAAQDLYALVTKLASTGKHMDFFFMGRLWDTVLPPIYYPVVILYKTTPLVWLGLGSLACGLFGWLRKRRRGEARGLDGRWGGALVLAGFALFYTGTMALGSFKQERYMICVVAALEVAAAAGLVRAGRRLWAAWQRRGTARSYLVAALAGVSLFVLGHALPSLLTHPYYYSYYNPLLGGAPMAYRVIQVGSGEGVDQAMGYLNRQPQPARQTVVCGTNADRCAYASAGQQILKQKSLNYTDSNWVGADYVLTYVFQQQRGNYPAGVLHYLAQHGGAEKTVTLSGLEYAVVYRAPHAQHVAASYLPGVATLLGYNLGAIHIAAGRPLQARLYLQSDGFADQQLYLRLDDADGRVRARTLAHMPPAVGGDDLQARGTVFEAEAELPVPPEMPPGLYFLKIGVLSADGSTEIGMFKLPSDGDDVVVDAVSGG